MKKLLILLAAFVVSDAMYAQHNHKENANQQKEQTDHAQDHMMIMMDGKMIRINNGKSTVMDIDIKLSNGTTVTKNGRGKNEKWQNNDDEKR